MWAKKITQNVQIHSFCVDFPCLYLLRLPFPHFYCLGSLVSVNWKAKSVPRWWTEDLGETSMAEDVYALKTVYVATQRPFTLCWLTFDKFALPQSGCLEFFFLFCFFKDICMLLSETWSRGPQMNPKSFFQMLMTNKKIEVSVTRKNWTSTSHQLYKKLQNKGLGQNKNLVLITAPSL